MIYDDFFEAMDSIFEDAKTFSEEPKKYVAPQYPVSELKKLKDGTLKFRFSLAGYKREDITLSTQENKLVLSTASNYKVPELEEGAKILSGCIKLPSFRSSFVVPETKYNFNDIEATFMDGILTVTIPPKEKKENKPIVIN